METIMPINTITVALRIETSDSRLKRVPRDIAEQFFALLGLEPTAPITDSLYNWWWTDIKTTKLRLAKAKRYLRIAQKHDKIISIDVYNQAKHKLSPTQPAPTQPSPIIKMPCTT